MQPIRLALMCLVLAAAWVLPVHAGSYRLTDGSTVTGDPVAYGETGLILRDNPRIPWARLSQESLKQLAEEAKTPKDRAFVEPFIENLAREARLMKPIVVKVPEFQQSEDERKQAEAKKRPAKGLFALFGSPLGLLLLVVAYGANIYAGYEMATFRVQSPVMGIGLGLIPLIGPMAFIFIPTKSAPPQPEEEEEETIESSGEAAPVAAPAEPGASGASAPSAAPAPAPVPQSISKKRGQAPTITMGAGSTDIGLAGSAGGANAAAVTAAASEAAATPQAMSDAASNVQIFEKGKFIFNRRFFETKMPGFFRAVPREEEKDLVVYIRAARGEFVGRRITSIDQTQLALQVFKGAATADETIPFMEILEVRIQPQAD